MQRGELARAGDVVAHHDEGIAAEKLDRLGYGGEVVEHVLGPQRHGKPRHAARGIEIGIFRLGEPQKVRHQSLFVHPVRRGHVPGARDDAAVLRGPLHGAGSDLAAAAHAARKDQISGSISSFQSMERAVSTVLPGPSYTTLVHAAASGSPAAHAMTAAAHPAMNFLRPFIYAYAKHTPCHKPRRDGRDPEIGVPAPCNGAARGRRTEVLDAKLRKTHRFRVRFVSLR